MTAPRPDSEHSSAAAIADGDSEKIVAVFNLVLTHRRRLVWAAIVGGTLAAAVLFSRPRSYTASSSFVPQARRSSSGIAGLAAQFNLAVPSIDAAQSPAFYAELLQSRQLLGSVVEGPFEYEMAGKPEHGTLVEALQIKGPSEVMRRDAAIDRLLAITASSVATRTGVIHITAQARTPAMALQIAQRLLTVLDQFNMSTRRTQAHAERQFSEQRLAETLSEMRAAEDRLQEFLQRNRDYRNSPTLSFQYDRLQNELSMRRQLYGSVGQAYEQARLDEVRDTPLITVIENPAIPVKPDGRGIVRKTILGAIVGFFVMFGLLFVRRFANPLREMGKLNPFEENVRLRAALIAELKRPWRLLLPA